MYAQESSLLGMKMSAPVCMSCQSCVCWTRRGSSDQGNCTHLTVWAETLSATKGVITASSYGCKHWIPRNPDIG